MKKLILGIALILSFAFTKAQTMDSTYNSDTAVILKDTKVEKLDTVPRKTSIVFYEDNTVTFTTGTKVIKAQALGLLDIIVLDSITIKSFEVTTGGQFAIVGITTVNGLVRKVGFLRENGTFIVFLITKESRNDSSNNARIK